MAASAPPWDLWPLALIGLIPLCIAARRVSPGRAAAIGGIAGLAFHGLAQSWWIGLLDRFTDLSFPARIGVASLIVGADAALIGVWMGMTRLLVLRARLQWIAVAPIAIGLIESLWPSFFEWHLGVALWRAWPLVQVAEIGGPAAVSSLLVLINVVLADLGTATWQRRRPQRAAWVGAGCAALVIASSFVRGEQIETIQRAAPQIESGIVQPNFGVLTRDERSRDGRHLIAALRAATRDVSMNGVELVIWPESAWPYYWDRRLERDFRSDHPWSLRNRAPTSLLIGALTHPFGSGDLYNSAVLLRGSGDIGGTYDKRSLVPFSEFVPFGDGHPEWKEAVQRYVPDRPEIMMGTGPRVLEDGSIRIGPLICSEDLDTYAAIAAAREGANLLVSMANDSWFGGSIAVQQHLALSAFRAVEARRHMIRATTNGISAHFDALGRLKMESSLVEPVDPKRASPTLLRARVALIDTQPLGLATIPYFPHACASLLATAYMVGRNRKTADPVSAGSWGIARGTSSARNACADRSRTAIINLN